MKRTLFYGARIYSVDQNFSMADAMLIEGDKIVELGEKDGLKSKYSDYKEVNLQGKFVFPGLYDAHCHLLRYANQFQEVNLFGTTSFKEVIERIKAWHKENPEAKAIIGRGWDHEKWQEAVYPHKSEIDLHFPSIPLFITRVDLHSALVNSAALNLANIKAGEAIEGGVFGHDSKGDLNGLLIDSACIKVSNSLPKIEFETQKELMLKAQADCFEVGLTSLSEAWVESKDVKLFEDLYREGNFKIRVYGMLEPSKENLKRFLSNGPLISDKLHLRCFKYFADGALGSRGAWLKEYYSDDSSTKGLQLIDSGNLKPQAKQYKEAGFQMATHCIGDAANEQMLNLYAEVLEEKNDLRWRIEHAQILPENAFSKFKELSIIPSIQTTHATSDMYWVKQRIGEERIKDSYAWKRLLIAAGTIPNGSDLPVEPINPLYGFHAAISRQDRNNFPKDGFQKEDALTRIEALKAMTIWAAHANFEDQSRGSLEAGKLADFVILDRDIMEVKTEETWKVKVLQTYLGGDLVFCKEDL